MQAAPIPPLALPNAIPHNKHTRTIPDNVNPFNSSRASRNLIIIKVLSIHNKKSAIFKTILNTKNFGLEIIVHGPRTGSDLIVKNEVFWCFKKIKMIFKYIKVLLYLTIYE